MLGSTAFTILALLAGAELASAHGYVYSWTVNGETRRGPSPGSSSYSGAGRPTDNTNWGPAQRDAASVACGGQSAGSGLDTWDLDAGSEVIAQWTGPKNGNSVWPPEHLGPVMEYMARCPGSSCDGVAADSLDWFKISEATWDGTEWPSAKINRDEDWSFKIPSDIAPGPYLVRTEIIAMHFEWAKKGFEVYPYCFQANVVSSGDAVPSDTVTFPAAYDPSNYEWYDYSYPWDSRDPASYVPPGPAVYSGGGTPSTGNATSISSSASTPAPSQSGSSEEPTLPTDGNTTPTDVEQAPSASETEASAPTVSVSEEYEASTTAAPEQSSTAGSDDSETTSPVRSTRTRGWWRNWRNTRTSSAAAAVATTASEETEYDDDLQRRNVVKRYGARRLGM